MNVILTSTYMNSILFIPVSIIMNPKIHIATAVIGFSNSKFVLYISFG